MRIVIDQAPFFLHDFSCRAGIIQDEIDSANYSPSIIDLMHRINGQAD